MPSQQQIINKRFRIDNEHNMGLLRNRLQCLSWDNCNVSDVDLAYESFHHTFETDLNECMPVTFQKINIHNNKYRPWMTQGILISRKGKKECINNF